MLHNIWNSIERSGYINIFNGTILFIGFAIAFTLVGVFIYESDKKK